MDRVLRAIGIASWRFDVAQSRVTTDSAHLQALLGQATFEGIAPSALWLEVVHPADRDWLGAYRELMIGDPGTGGYECSYRILMPEGRERWLREVVRFERDVAQQATLLVGVVENITDRREREEKGAEGAERFRAAFEDAHAGIAMVALDGAFLEVNNGFAEIVGRTISEVLLLRLRDVVHRDDGCDDVGVAPIPAATTLARRERRYLRADGDVRWVIESASLIHDAEARPSYYIIQALDFTERRNAETALKNTEAQLLQAQKMEALGQLAGGVAHDFNNLLTVIKSYSQMVLSTLVHTDPNHEDLTEVVGAADRAAALTKQLLAFSRKQAQHWQILRVDRVVADTERMLRRLIGTDAALVVEAGPDVSEVEADKGQLEQVIMNLVVNARDAMPHGGRIGIATRDVALAHALEDTIPSLVPAGRYVVLEITDSGTGMSAETIGRIFEPFFTTKAAGHGTGLGLSTVYGIVQQCGGFLAVSSVVGEGTTFRVYLPRHSDEGQRFDGIAERATKGGTETVLVVEDDDAVRTLIRHVLVRLGYSVLAARDAKEAQQIAAAFDQQIHLLLCDVHLPGASGYRAAEQIRSTRRESQVLFMSGHTELSVGEDEPSALAASFRRLELLTKPFSVEELAHAVRDAIDTGRQNSSINEVRSK